MNVDKVVITISLEFIIKFVNGACRVINRNVNIPFTLMYITAKRTEYRWGNTQPYSHSKIYIT